MPECLRKDEYAVLTRAWLLTAGAGVNEGGMEGRIMMCGKTKIFSGKGRRESVEGDRGWDRKDTVRVYAPLSV